MSLVIRRRPQLLVWTLIAVCGGLAGWWQAMRVRAGNLGELLDDVQRCAVAFPPGEMSTLAATPADLANPAYLSIKTRLARLRQVHADIRSVCIIRYVTDTGRVVLLADSEPPDSRKISNPGDEYASTAGRPDQRAVLRGN